MDKTWMEQRKRDKSGDLQEIVPFVKKKQDSVLEQDMVGLIRKVEGKRK